MNVNLEKSLKAWQTPEFNTVLKAEVLALDHKSLPLQQGLSHSSYVSDSEISVVILNAEDTGESIRVKAGIFYGGIIAGSCCADDPTPVCEENEYCEVMLNIDKATASTGIELSP